MYGLLCGKTAHFASPPGPATDACPILAPQVLLTFFERLRDSDTLDLLTAKGAAFLPSPRPA